MLSVVKTQLLNKSSKIFVLEIVFILLVCSAECILLVFANLHFREGTSTQGYPDLHYRKGALGYPDLRYREGTLGYPDLRYGEGALGYPDMRYRKVH